MEQYENLYRNMEIYGNIYKTIENMKIYEQIWKSMKIPRKYRKLKKEKKKKKEQIEKIVLAFVYGYVLRRGAYVGRFIKH